MRKLMLSLGAATMAVSTMVLPVSSAEARKHYYKTYRGKNGRTYCTRSGGTTGLVAGGAGGALIGNRSPAVATSCSAPWSAVLRAPWAGARSTARSRRSVAATPLGQPRLR